MKITHLKFYTFIFFAFFLIVLGFFARAPEIHADLSDQYDCPESNPDPSCGSWQCPIPKPLLAPPGADCPESCNYVYGIHYTCSGSSCDYVDNSSGNCSDSCSGDVDCGGGGGGGACSSYSDCPAGSYCSSPGTPGSVCVETHYECQDPGGGPICVRVAGSGSQDSSCGGSCSGGGGGGGGCNNNGICEAGEDAGNCGADCSGEPVVNGACGSSDGQSFSSAPSSNLCSQGSASSVSGGSGSPWTWSCYGSNGGSNALCSAGYTPPQPDNAQCQNLTVPATVTAGSLVPFSLTMFNTGTNHWTGRSITPGAPYYLGIDPWGASASFGDAADFGRWIYIDLSGTDQDVHPGQTASFDGSNSNNPVLAPSTPGTYTFSWRMGHQGTAIAFGQACSRSITVTGDFSLTADAPSPPSVTAGNSSSILVHVNAVNGGVSGLVDVAPPASLPSGWAWVQGTQSVAVGGTVSFTLNTTAAAQTQTNYPLTFTGTNGSLTHTAVTNMTVTAPPSCPAASVHLSLGTVTVGGSVTASTVDAGFTGGSFNHSNGNASVSGSTVTGQAAGSVDITGSNWNYSNGATGCSLSAATLTVQTGPPGGGGAGSVTAACVSPNIHLSWSAGAGATSYNIYRAGHPGSPGAVLATVNNATVYDDATASGNNDYWVESAGDGGTKVAATQNSTGVACGAPGPASVTLSNSVVCSKVSIYWTDMSASSYKIYRNQTGTAPTIGVTAPAYSGLPLATAASPYTDSGVAAGQTYYYWITGVISGVESQATAGAQNPIGPTACVADLGDSVKNIVAINDAAVSPAPGQCNGFVPLPSGTALTLGDKLKFRLDLCNDLGRGTASNISVSDNLTNLIVPLSGWNARYNGSALTYDGTSNSGLSNHYYLSGVVPNQTLTFNLTAAGNNIAQGAIATITFEALLSVPAGATGSASRFQNCFNAAYNAGTVNRCTPYIPFYTGQGNPTIIEVP